MKSEVRPSAEIDAVDGVPAEGGLLSHVSASHVIRIAKVSLCVFFILALMSLSVTVWLHIKSTSTAVADLREQIDYLKLNQGLLIAEVRAGSPSSKVADAKGASEKTSQDAAFETSNLVSVDATESALGIHIRFGRIEELKQEADKGWLLKYQIGNYTEGKLAMVIASNHGDVFNGEYYVLKISSRPQGTLLRNAKIEVYGLNKTSPFLKETISAEKFINLFWRNTTETKALKDAWFRLKVTPYGDIMAAQQLSPKQ